jgi:hypothetical protein
MGCLGLRTRWAPIALLSAIAVAGASRADLWPAPHNTVFASKYGSHGVGIRVKNKSADEIDQETATKPQGERQYLHVTARLFRLDEPGNPNPQTIWQKPIPFVPSQVLVSDSGDVVSIDEYFQLGYRHALVVFNRQGDIIADYKLEDLLTPTEIKWRVQCTVSSRHWMMGAVTDFTYGSFLLIRLKWGKLITVDLDSGKLWPGFDPTKYDREKDREKAMQKYRQQHGL